MAGVQILRVLLGVALLRLDARESEGEVSLCVVCEQVLRGLLAIAEVVQRQFRLMRDSLRLREHIDTAQEIRHEPELGRVMVQQLRVVMAQIRSVKRISVFLARETSSICAAGFWLNECEVCTMLSSATTKL